MQNYRPAVEQILKTMVSNTIVSSPYFQNPTLRAHTPSEEELVYMIINWTLNDVARFQQYMTDAHVTLLIRTAPRSDLHLVAEMFADRLSAEQIALILSALPLAYKGPTSWAARGGLYYFAKKFRDAELSDSARVDEASLFLATLHTPTSLSITWPDNEGVLAMAALKASDLVAFLSLNPTHYRQVYTWALLRAPYDDIEEIWALTPVNFRHNEIYEIRRNSNEIQSDDVTMAALEGRIDNIFRTVCLCHPEYLVRIAPFLRLGKRAESYLIIRATADSLLTYTVRHPDNNQFYNIKTNFLTSVSTTNTTTNSQQLVAHLKCAHLYLEKKIPPAVEHLVYLNMTAAQIENYWRIHEIVPSLRGLSVWSARIDPLKIFTTPEFIKDVDMSMLLARCPTFVEFVKSSVAHEPGQAFYKLALMKANGDLTGLELIKPHLDGANLALYLAYERRAAPSWGEFEQNWLTYSGASSLA